MPKLTQSFYTGSNVVRISKELLGKILYTNISGKVTGGIIVETEAYAGPEDRASHAWNNRRTKRTETMFQEGGIAYVYLCYGMHSLFNVVTNKNGIPHAILIRAIEPTVNTEAILKRRNKAKLDRSVAGGPGMLSKGLAISTSHSGISLSGSTIWIEDAGTSISSKNIIAGPRVGVDYAGLDAKKPWRFKISNNPWTSKPD